MERKLKERLLGAIVLVVFAVLVVPALLDGPPEVDTTVRESLSLPAPGSADNRRHTIDLTDNRDTLPAPANDPPPATRTAATAQPGAASAPVRAPSDEPAPAPTPPGPAAEPPDEPRGAAPAAQPTASDASPPPARAAATTPPARTPLPETPPGAAGWAVQVGSFSSERNALRLAELMEQRDYPAFVVRNVVDGRVMYRVRVGPATEPSQAQAWLERLREEGQPAQLVSHP